MSINNPSRFSCTILLTCIGGTMSADLILGLKNDPILDMKIVGVDASENPTSKVLVDAFYQVPFGGAIGYEEVILKIVKEHNVQVIVPGSDQEAMALSAMVADLEQLGAKVTTSPTSVLNLIKDKLITYQELEKSGVNLPNYLCLSSLAEVKSGFDFFDYPNNSVVLKPIAGRGGRGLRVLESEKDSLPLWIGNGLREKRYNYIPNDQEIEDWVAEGSQMLMPALRDPAYDVDVFSVQGKAQAIIIRRRYNPVGIPFTGNTIQVNEKIFDYCSAISNALKLDGLHDIDLMSDKEGNPALLEVNPRMSGSVAAAHSAGYPIVSFAIASSLNIPYPFENPVKDIEIGVFQRCFVKK